MKYAAVWMDHAKAIIVKAEHGNITTAHLESGIEPHHHGGEAEGEHLTITNQHRHDNARHEEMKAFVKQLLKILADMTEVHLMGPGNAKFDLKNALEDEPSMKGKLKSCETTDKMHDEEIIAWLRKTYQMA